MTDTENFENAFDIDIKPQVRNFNCSFSCFMSGYIDITGFTTIVHTSQDKKSEAEQFGLLYARHTIQDEPYRKGEANPVEHAEDFSLIRQNIQPENNPSENQDRKKQLENLLVQLRNCRHCQDRFGYEPRPIQWGNPDARIMHISQAPGRKVHEIGRPFSDLSGKRLREQWYDISEDVFYDKDSFYFTTMGHCFPGKSEKGNYDRKPPKCCYDMWTRHEIELMDTCQLYLVVGAEAASRLFPGRKLTELVFEDQQLHGRLCYVLPHPSPLNRKWFKDHPEFEDKRIPVIRKKIHEILDLAPEDVME